MDIHDSSGEASTSYVQAMWEDKKAGTKWVSINQCYFARELPQSVGRPCLENNNEVNN